MLLTDLEADLSLAIASSQLVSADTARAGLVDIVAPVVGQRGWEER